MYLLVVTAETEGEKLRTMLSIEFLMLQFKRYKDQVSPPKHIRLRWRHAHQTPTEKVKFDIKFIRHQIF